MEGGVVASPVDANTFYGNRADPEGLLVQAFTREQPDAIQKVRTNAAGRAEVLLSRPGTWFIKAVQIQPIMGDPKALWQSYWASYLFTVE
jgi:hypothetical protein